MWSSLGHLGQSKSGNDLNILLNGSQSDSHSMLNQYNTRQDIEYIQGCLTDYNNSNIRLIYTHIQYTLTEKPSKKQLKI